MALCLTMGAAAGVLVSRQRALLDDGPPSPTRARSTTVWCEGLPLERCGEHPRDCRVSAYCDGVKFCTDLGTDPPDLSCGEAGYAGGGVACCRGMVPRCGALRGDGACDTQAGTERQPLCIACGDGVCDALEQRCNCPEDCATRAARPRITYRGERPQGPDPRLRAVPPGVSEPGGCLDALDSPDGVRACLTTWAQALFGRTSVAELRLADNIEPFTAFDLDVLACLEWEATQADCLHDLMRRSQDSRLRRLLSPAHWSGR